jgi:hypothetical protein
VDNEDHEQDIKTITIMPPQYHYDDRFTTSVSNILTLKYDDEACAGSIDRKAYTWQVKIN